MRVSMLSQTYYLIRSKLDGSYLVARPRLSSNSPETPQSNPGYLLLFREDFEALSYLNTHGSDLANRFGIESASGAQVEGLLKRWGFTGVGLVQDPLVPRVEFLSRE